MATIEQLKSALLQAHKAGDKRAAKLFADTIKGMQSQVPEQALQPALQPQQDLLRAEQAATPMNEDFIPTGENLAAEQARTDAIPERTLSESAIGTGDAALTMGFGATTGALGFGLGTLEGAVGELTGRLNEGEGLKVAQKYAEALTYLPKTKEGQEIVKFIGEKLGTLPPVLGTTPVAGLNATKGGWVGKQKFAGSKNKIISSIANDVPANVQKSFAKKLGKDRFQPHIFGMVREARRQGFDDGVTTLVANASPITRRGMMRQVMKVEKAKGDRKARALERTADIPGEALVRQHNFVLGNKKQAGAQLGRVAKKLKKESVNINEPINSFLDGLDRLGVKFDEKGKPNYKNAIFEDNAPAEALVNTVVKRIKRNDGFSEVDGLSAHEFKKFIDEQVSYGKQAEGGLGKVEGVVKSLRREVNDSISSISKDYKQANKQFSDTVTVLDELESVAGKKLDFSGRHADKAAGTLLRSQTNNTGKRANLLTAIEDLEVVANKYGGSFDDDILSLSIFAEELDTIFGTGATTSLRGEVGKAGFDTAVDVSQMTVLGAGALAAKEGARRLRGINEKNQLKSIKKLLKGNK